ncbi:MAG: site-specific integrase [Candidatus Eisenbacteria bacterium]|nr:site-specific integrase [Candidatus Eisenbacteria bacterium]
MKEQPGRIRYLTPEEAEKLLVACDPQSLREKLSNTGRSLSNLMNIYLKPIVLIALNSGMRRGEILRLKWKNIDFQARRITIENTKNNERRTVYMNETLCRTLKSLPIHLHSEIVFPDINGNMLTVAFERACRRGGIEDFRFHDLRHTFASYLTMGGANLRTVQTLLGHKDVRMTIRYSHLSPEYLNEAVRTLEKDLVLISNSHYLDTGGK